MIAQVQSPAQPLLRLSGLRVFVAGHRGMVGSALVRRLAREDCELMTVERAGVDLRDEAAVTRYVLDTKPDVVIIAAARVGGILANNSFPVQFLSENLSIAQNLIGASHRAGVRKLLFLGSSCIYPRNAAQPMTEDLLLSGPLEPTNEWYAVAKIAGIKLCQAYRRQYGADFISVMPTNLYGPGDNYHPDHSHVPAALLRRIHDAKRARASSVVVWGTGKPRREFLFVEDLADACVFVLEHYSGEGFLNVGTGQEITIADFAHLIGEVVGYQGRFGFDASKPDGMPRKLLDVSKLEAMGWHARTDLRTGLERTYSAFLSETSLRISAVERGLAAERIVGS